MFNNHFSTIGSKIEQKIQFVPGSYKEYFNKKDEFYYWFKLKKEAQIILDTLGGVHPYIEARLKQKINDYP